VAGRKEAEPDGFLVPHSDPPHRPDPIVLYSYGWCNGPAGDAQVFRLLGRMTTDEAWTALGDRYWRTVRESGLPHRIRPGFWDNNPRCCGTAGVLALACDRIVERGDDFGFANVLVDDLTARATVDDAGARWSNHEQPATPSDLEPRAGWAMGNAGINRELLRYARLSEDGPAGYAVSWPGPPPSQATLLRLPPHLRDREIRTPAGALPPTPQTRIAPVVLPGGVTVKTSMTQGLRGGGYAQQHEGH
jgi:hypothetical protein